MVHVFNPSIREAEAGSFLSFNWTPGAQHRGWLWISATTSTRHWMEGSMMTVRVVANLLKGKASSGTLFSVA